MRMGTDWSPVKEPVGFIRVLEWFTAVFAFATCISHTSRGVVSLLCGAGHNETLNFAFGFPFRLNRVLLVEGNATLCNRSVQETHLVGDSASSAGFFVAVSILAFFYCMSALLLYITCMPSYQQSQIGPKLDLVVTVLFTFLWLVCSSAWAKGLHNVKVATSTAGISATLSLCQGQGVVCEVTEVANTRSLNVSVAFGFLSLILWAGNAWFVYKETNWHVLRNSTQHSRVAPTPTPSTT